MVSNFLEEISSLSHSVVFLYFFALIAEEGFLISSCYPLELCIQMDVYLSFSPVPLASLPINAKHPEAANKNPFGETDGEANGLAPSPLPLTQAYLICDSAFYSLIFHDAYNPLLHYKWGLKNRS